MESSVIRAQQFEALVLRILSANHKVEASNRASDAHFDALLKCPHSNCNVAVEVKVYGSDATPSALLETTVGRLLQSANDGNITRVMVVVSSTVSAAQSERFNQLGAIVVDRNDLAFWVKNDHEMLKELHELTIVDEQSGFETPRFRSLEEALNSISMEQPLSSSQKQVEDRAAATRREAQELRDELRAIHPGKKDAYKYEAAIRKICRFLFEESISISKPQETINDDLHRIEFHGEVKPSESRFWRFAREYMNSLIVVFECKNYKAPIGPDQIYTTERYLFGKAFRRIAFVFTRHDAKSKAARAVAGAMRENGYLILIVTDADVERMLDDRANGNDPSDHLYEMTVQLLMEMSR